tara:strand:+ start:532 stop:834 length:303 start_codon:yes stop_codon:yes gene_type:complete
LTNLQAQSINVWQGGIGNWNVASNWSQNEIPSVSDRARILAVGDVVTIPSGYTALVCCIKVADGAELIINGDTVKTHLKRIFAKMDVKSRTQAVALLLRS